MGSWSSGNGILIRRRQDGFVSTQQSRIPLHPSRRRPVNPSRLELSRSFLITHQTLVQHCPSLLMQLMGFAKNLVRSASASILAGLAYIENADAMRAMVISHFKTKYQTGGARAVLAAFADGEQGHHGLTKASAATKASVVEQLVKQGAISRVDKWFHGPSATRLIIGQVMESRAVAAALGAAIAVGVSAVAGRRRR